MAAERSNYGFLDRLPDGSAGELATAVQSMIPAYPEPEVLRYVAEATVGGDRDTGSDARFRDAHRALVFVHIKTVLDALIGHGPA
jgi:hypothetical protein